jgi:hypothetical protein
MRRIVGIHGLVAGALLSLVMAATLPFHDRLGEDLSLVIGYASMVGAFLLVFFGVRSYRDRVAGGHIGFGRAFGVGALIALIASGCYVATWEVIYFTAMPDYLERYQARQIEKARTEGASEADIAAQSAEMAHFQELYRNPLFNAAVTLMEPLPVGLLLALVSATLLRRREPDGLAAQGPS